VAAEELELNLKLLEGKVEVLVVVQHTQVQLALEIHLQLPRLRAIMEVLVRFLIQATWVVAVEALEQRVVAPLAAQLAQVE
jgi:hypothetical protein